MQSNLGTPSSYQLVVSNSANNSTGVFDITPAATPNYPTIPTNLASSVVSKIPTTPTSPIYQTMPNSLINSVPSTPDITTYTMDSIPSTPSITELYPKKKCGRPRKYFTEEEKQAAKRMTQQKFFLKAYGKVTPDHLDELKKEITILSLRMDKIFDILEMFADELNMEL